MYNSTLKDLICNAAVCTATYGKAQDNILSVQGSAGSTITFKVDQQVVRTFTFTPDTVTELNLDLTVPVASQDPVVTNLQSPSQGTTWIYWNWTNPASVTHIEIWLDGMFKQNVTVNYYNATSLSADTNYELQTKAASSAGLSSQGVNHQSSTLASCTSVWQQCSNWTTCSNSTQTRACTDTAACNPAASTRNETQACGQNTTITPLSCEYAWQCTIFSDCANNEQSRTCQRTDQCDARFAADEVTTILATPQPALRQSCTTLTTSPASAPLASCTDGIKNQNEQQADCGGVCPACVELKTDEEPFSWKQYALPAGIILAVIIIGIIMVYILINRHNSSLSPAVSQQLQSYYQRNLQRGLSKDQIMENLLKGGWEKKIVKKFLRSSHL